VLEILEIDIQFTLSAAGNSPCADERLYGAAAGDHNDTIYIHIYIYIYIYVYIYIYIIDQNRSSG